MSRGTGYIASMLLFLLLLLLIAAFIPGSRGYYLWYMRQAESYIPEIEKFKTERGYYPDENNQTIVEISESNPYFYESDGKQYCVGFSVGFDDTYRLCSTTRSWTYGGGPPPFRHEEAPVKTRHLLRSRFIPQDNCPWLSTG